MVWAQALVLHLPFAKQLVDHQHAVTVHLDAGGAGLVAQRRGQPLERLDQGAVLGLVVGDIVPVVVPLVADHAVAGSDLVATIALARISEGAAVEDDLRILRDVTAALENFRFNDASGILYRFVWNQFCDWYLELLKPVFSGEDEKAKRESQACAAYVLDEIYKLLHPFMPFMTEELWAHTAGEGEERDNLLCLTDWPVPRRKLAARGDARYTEPCDGLDQCRSSELATKARDLRYG